MQLLISFVLLSIVSSQFVTNSYGILRGAYAESSNKVLVEMYKSVPYAAPPIQELRYSLPENPKAWKGIKDASLYSAACMSNTTRTSSPQKYISEDCLYLNIFVSSRCRLMGSCSVLFYIHGGALLFDSATMFPDDHLVDHFAAKDVIFVIPGYRLGSFGLFSSEFQDLAPSNIAIYDLIKALRFVRNEIHHFGGEKSKITVMGHSMGADLALSMAFSKQVHKPVQLFRGAIALSPGMTYKNLESMYESSWKFAIKTGCASGSRHSRHNVEEAIACMRNMTSSDLLRIQKEMELGDNVLFNGLALTSPLIESGSLVELLSNPPPVALTLGGTVEEFDGTPDTIEKIGGGDFLQLHNPMEVTMKYLVDLSTQKLNTTHVYGSQAVYVSTYLYGSAMSLRGNAPAYLYLFDMPQHNHHTSDLCYIMGIHCFDMSSDEILLNSFHSEHFVNFTKFGEPSPGWTRLFPKLRNFYHISVDAAKGLGPYIDFNYQRDICDYWLGDMLNFDVKLTIRKKTLPLL